MFTVFIYNIFSKRLERYSLEAYENMPYTKNHSMRVSDFFSGSASCIGWTSNAFLESWDLLSGGTLRPSHVFRRIFEGGHIQHSMHFAGLAADFKSNRDIERTATHRDFFPVCEIEANKIHVSMNRGPSAFPPLKKGDSGLFVLILQDSLNALGFTGGCLDGYFGKKTEHSLAKFKSACGLDRTPVVDNSVWKTLTFHAAGCGITPTVSHIVQRPDEFFLFS